MEDTDCVMLVTRILHFEGDFSYISRAAVGLQIDSPLIYLY
jgi:hypothetical protein